MSQEDTVRDHFDRMGADGRYARFYEPVDTSRTHDFLARMARVEELLTPYAVTGTRVLDVGCGTGPMVEYFASRGLFYHGLDVAPRMLHAIQDRYQGTSYGPRIELRLGSADSIPYPSEHFDSVVGMGLLEYLEDPQPALGEIARVLKTSGVAVLTVPNRNGLNRFVTRHADPITAVYRFWKRLRRQPRTEGSGIIHYEFVPRVLDELLSRRGFRTVGRSFYDYRPVCYPFTRIAPAAAFHVNRLFENRGPSFFANGYIGLYQKLGPAGSA